jgi:hypothetical protein
VRWQAGSSRWSVASEEGDGIMYCAISGVTPDDPVVSRQSGLLYERRLILKHLEVLHNLS